MPTSTDHRSRKIRLAAHAACVRRVAARIDTPELREQIATYGSHAICTRHRYNKNAIGRISEMMRAELSLPGPETKWAYIPKTRRRYCISVRGSVRTCARVPAWLGLDWIRDRWGYPLVHVFTDEGRTTVYVHQAVLEIFGPARPSPDHIVCHKDDDKERPHLSNLYWGTHKTNAQDRIRNRTTCGQVGRTPVP